MSYRPENLMEMKLPPTPRELFKRAGVPNVKKVFEAGVEMGAMPVPSPDDLEKAVVGLVPSPKDIGKMGEELITGGITDKVLMASAIVTPPLLICTVAVGVVGVVVMLVTSRGGAP